MDWMNGQGLLNTVHRGDWIADRGGWTEVTVRVPGHGCLDCGCWQWWLNRFLTGVTEQVATVVTEQVSGQVCLNRLLTWVTEQFAGQGWLNKLLYIQRWLNKLLDSGGWAQWTGVTGHWTGLAGIYLGRRDVCICCNYWHEIRFASSPLIQNDDSQFIFSQKVCWRAIKKILIYKITIQSPKNLKNSHLHNFLQKNKKSQFWLIC